MLETWRWITIYYLEIESHKKKLIFSELGQPTPLGM